MRPLQPLPLVLAAALLAFPPPAPAAAPPGGDTAAVEHFEKRIRPVLAEQCYGCHSAGAAAKNKLRGGLRLDTRAGLRAGGDSGPAVVPGRPADSLLLRTLRHDGDVKMPPRGKLPDAVVADFAAWVQSGAIDPRGDAPTTTAAPGRPGVEKGRDFWAYRPVAAPAVPAGAADHEIDRFLEAARSARGLAPAPEAAPEVLVRRLCFDLTGLPPTPDEIRAFAADPGPAAYERLVDRLLASPRFGERWGRHWLDVARYAESVTLRGFVFPDAWRYRDYVIGAFNRDVPFDRFVREQVAGDLLPAATPADRERQLVASTYLMLGNTNLEEQDKKQLRMDVVDEQLDVIGKGLLAQTITCARCHDHKFDPIPQEDYYALAGILRNTRAMEHANVSRWVEVALPLPPAREAEARRHEEQIAGLKGKIQALRGKAPAGTAARGPRAVRDVPGVVVDDARAMKVGTWKDSTSTGTYIGGGYVHDDNEGKGAKTLTFQPDLPASGRYEVWLAYSHGPGRADRVPVAVFSAEGEKDLTVDMKRTPPVEGRFVSLGQYRFEKDGQSFVRISNEGTRGHVTADAVTFLPADKVPSPAPASTASTPAPDPAAGDLKTLEAALKKLEASAPRRPMAMAPHEEAKVEETRVHVRGSPHTLGAPVPRGVLRVATHGPPPRFPADASGRLQLADWIVRPDNPLTARVYVNRAWHWLFGRGLVRTVDNFGSTGEPPTHPELLDWLAGEFVRDGGSSKRLVRRLVLSRAYRQSSSNEASLAADPDNRLGARANRRRLDAECLRDAMLAAAGTLAPTAGGPTFPAGLAADYNFRTQATCRSVYLPVFRNALPELFEAFDFADPSLVTGSRNTSTVAPQALFMLNNPFVLAQSKRAAARLLAGPCPDDAARLTWACQLSLGRAPTDGERAVLSRWLASGERPREEAWASVFHALFASADFRTLE